MVHDGIKRVAQGKATKEYVYEGGRTVLIQLTKCTRYSPEREDFCCARCVSAQTVDTDAKLGYKRHSVVISE